MIVDSGGTSPVLLLGAIVGLVGLAVLVFVLFLGGLRGRDDKKKASKPGRKPQAATPEVAQDGEPAETPRQGEMMRVLRNPDTGRVLVEVEGRRYEHIREIEDAQVGRRVLWAIADLIRFTGGVATNPQAVRSASAAVDWEQGRPAPVSGAGRSALHREPGIGSRSPVAWISLFISVASLPNADHRAGAPVKTIGPRPSACIICEHLLSICAICGLLPFSG